MHKTHCIALDEEEHPVDIAGHLRPYFEEAVAEGVDERFSDLRPSPLRSADVLPNLSAHIIRKSPQPLAHGLVTGFRPVEHARQRFFHPLECTKYGTMGNPRTGGPEASPTGARHESLAPELVDAENGATSRLGFVECAGVHVVD